MSTTAAAYRGPVRADERALAPDLARGFMLLLIALANTPWYLWAAEKSGYGAHPVDGTALDRVVQFVLTVAVDGRIYPMFAFLFGYGMMRSFDRQVEAGADTRAAARLLRRRHLWLIVFGFVHAALLFMGDILGAYGVAGLVLGGLFLRRTERTIRVWAGVLGGVLVLLSALALVGAALAAMAPADAGAATAAGIPDVIRGSFANPSPVGAALNRISVWPVIVFGQGLALIVPAAILLGMAAARRRVLERPGGHVRLLAWTAVVGVAVAWGTAVPSALDHVGAVDIAAGPLGALEGARQLAGVFGGVGYVALFGLIGHLLSRRSRTGPLTYAVTAVGQRSMTCYLAQSVICAPVLAAWGLGLGGVLGSASMAAFAVGVWLVTVALAVALRRAGRRGPAEVLLRRLTYRRAAAAPVAAPAPEATR
jgi:uncharacterized membrane protein YeiB